MRNRKLVEQVQALYRSGKSKASIAKTLGIPSWNVSRWCRKEMSLGSIAETSSHQEKDRHHWFTFDKVQLRSLDLNSAKILVSLLYWCEGCKYPGTNKVEFVCSDEKMQETFIKLFRVAYKEIIDEKKFRVMLQLHTTHDVKKMIIYWSGILKIPESQFIKPHITEGKMSRYRSVYNGTCSIRYFDYKILLRMMGVYKQISEQVSRPML